MTSVRESSRRGRRAWAAAGAALLAGAGLVRSTPGADPAGSAALSAYRERLAPVFATRCCPCHGALAQEAGLRLDTVAGMIAGGESGPAVAPGNPAASLLVSRVGAADAALRMPPEGEGEPLDERQIATLRDWIAAGAPAPADERPAADPRDHWAFRRRVRPEVPAAGTGWARNPIDRFVARAHAARGLAPRPEAPRHVLVRRLYLDLVGLPPDDAEAAAVAAEAAPDWYERLVDRLLADPRHGERWARHWMDVWRYSDWWGLGDDHRNSQKHIWHWRDWIVESLAADVPYDEMVRQMLAADELYPEDAGRLRATGYLARSFFKWNRDQWLEETVEHVAKGFLGLTMNCTKCHDHKYDPIRQEDFYRMRAFFEPYHCRLDVVPGVPDLAQDGIPRVFDALPEAPTYLFVRGDAARPDTSRSIAPGVPAVFDVGAPAIEPVPLPPAAWQPGRRPEILAAARAAAERDVAAAERDLAAARATHAAALARADDSAPARPAPAAAAGPPICIEEFAAFRPDRWRRLGGTWRHEPGRMWQDLDGPVWSALELAAAPPRDFDVSIRLTLRGGSQFRSVGLVFDADRGADPDRPAGTAQLVYCSGHAPGPKVQGAFRDAGPWQYPAAAAAAIAFEPGRPHVLRVAARDTLVNAWLDDRPVLAWRSPLARRDGVLQLVTFDALVTFERVSLAPLAADAPLDDPGAALADATAVAQAEVAAREAARDAALAAGAAVERRSDAARAAWAAEDAAGTPDAERLASEARDKAGAAARAERAIAVAAARAEVARLRLELARAPAAGRPALEQKIEQARAAATRAEQAVAQAGTAFTPFVGAAWSATRFKTTERDDPAPPFPSTSTGRRRALAAWITDPRHPLTARVAVNHVWLRHMGQPLVATVFDFGRQGNVPDHPELLDWLASELVEGPAAGPAWGLRHLHRLIVTSATYRMSSSAADAGDAARIDPDNRFLWRREPIRLEAEVIRDALLAVAGRLDPARGGPPVPPAGQADSRRRSLYLFHSSVERSPLLTTFDGADVQECYRREQSVVPQQALALANAALVHESAAAVAARLAGAAGDDAFVDAAFRAVLGRAATPAEVTACRESLAAWRAQADGAADDPARRHLVWALFNHNDFVVLR